MSFTVIVNEQSGLAVVPDALQLTVVVPTEKNEPEAGEQVTVPQPTSPFIVVGAG